MEKQPFPDSLDGPRVALKKHSPDEAERMFRYVDRDRERLRRFLPWVDATTSVADEATYIQGALAKWDACAMFDYGLFRKSDDLYLGNIGVHSIAWSHERCELGYWILGDFEGQGLVSEAVGLVERAAFALGFHRIEIRCSSANQRSANIPRRSGYRLDGVLREDAVDNGRYRDTLVFSKLAGEGGR